MIVLMDMETGQVLKELTNFAPISPREYQRMVDFLSPEQKDYFCKLPLANQYLIIRGIWERGHFDDDARVFCRYIKAIITARRRLEQSGEKNNVV